MVGIRVKHRIEHRDSECNQAHTYTDVCKAENLGERKFKPSVSNFKDSQYEYEASCSKDYINSLLLPDWSPENRIFRHDCFLFQDSEVTNLPAYPANFVIIILKEVKTRNKTILGTSRWFSFKNKIFKVLKWISERTKTVVIFPLNENLFNKQLIRIPIESM